MERQGEEEWKEGERKDRSEEGEGVCAAGGW